MKLYGNPTDPRDQYLTRRKLLGAGGTLAASVAAPTAFVALAGFSGPAAARTLVEKGDSDVLTRPISRTEQYRWRQYWAKYRYADGITRTDRWVNANRDKWDGSKWVYVRNVSTATKYYENGEWWLQCREPTAYGRDEVAVWKWKSMEAGGPGCRRLAAAGGAGTAWMDSALPQGKLGMAKEIIEAPLKATASFAYASWIEGGNTVFKFFQRSNNEAGSHNWLVSGETVFSGAYNSGLINAFFTNLKEFRGTRSKMNAYGYTAAAVVTASTILATCSDVFTDAEWADGSWPLAVGGALIGTAGYAYGFLQAMGDHGANHEALKVATAAFSGWQKHELQDVCDNPG